MPSQFRGFAGVQSLSQIAGTFCRMANAIDTASAIAKQVKVPHTFWESNRLRRIAISPRKAIVMIPSLIATIRRLQMGM
jgi:hypothetical protein